MKKHAKLPIICPTHETPEHTAPFPMTANAVSNIVAHKLARNTAANSTEDLIGSDEASQAEPLYLLSMFAKAEHPGSFSLPANQLLRETNGLVVVQIRTRDTFATNIDKHDNKTLVMILDLKTFCAH